ncbi:TetR/AcrR family transcriptional regulator [Paenibacillus sp. 1P07SE]|uniref:TetR/AcrR family transcriptional regulator n=1 Tax=Paenibacillus sp. 1P07SE TaxID=3132209 RepID=UPI0039A57E7B
MSAAPGEKWTIILDAAYRLFGTKGFYETKMSEIADEAGIAKGTLYLYFSSKEELFTAMTKRDHDRFLSQLQRMLQPDNSLQEQLHAVASHHLSYYFGVKNYPRLFFQAPNSDQALMEMMHAFRRNYMSIIASMLEAAGIEEPHLHGASFIGILEVFKMDILTAKTFTDADLQRRIAFAVRLFHDGCGGALREQRESP